MVIEGTTLIQFIFVGFKIVSTKKRTTTKALNKAAKSDDAAKDDKKTSEEIVIDFSDFDHQYQSAYDFVADTPRPRLTPYTLFKR